jgi:two-component system, sensor histidine kinase PdtaS
MNLRLILVVFAVVAHLSTLFGQNEAQETFSQLEKDFFHYVWQDVDSAALIINQMEQLAELHDEPEFYSKAINARGTLYYSMADYSKALEFYTAAYGYAKSWGDPLYIGKVLNNVGACHLELTDLDRAAEYFSLALESFRKAKNTTWEWNATYNLANVELRNSNFSRADSLYAQLEQEYLRANLITEAGYCNMGRGDVAHNTGRYSDAVAFYELALQRVNINDDSYTFALILQNKSYSLFELEQFGLAKSLLRQSTEIALRNKYNKIRLTNYELLAQHYKSTGSADSAIFYLERSAGLRDTIYNEAKQNEFTLAETRFKTSLKEETIALQEELIKEKNQLIFWMTILSLSLLVLSAVLFIVFRLLRQNKRNLEYALNEKEALLREIHHRVKNNLQVISSLLNMHVRKVTDPESKKILEEGSERLLAMALIHKNLYPHSDLSSISLKDYLASLCKQLLDNYSLKHQEVKLELSLENITVDIDKLIPIGLIVNELLSNSMKHAFDDGVEGCIAVGLKSIDSKTIELCIADNGRGVDPSKIMEKSGSLGMKLVKIFSDKLNTKLEYDVNHGTKIKLIIPV